MKGLPITVLALVFAFFSLISLLMAAHDSDNRMAVLSDSPGRVSELGLRVTFQR